MKTFVAILGICIAEVTDEEKAKLFEPDEKTCMKQTGIDEGMLEKLLKEKNMDQNNKKLSCFVACMSKTIGWMNADGSINESKLIVRGGVDKQRAVMMRNKCKVMKGANDCETAWKVINCMYEEDKLL
ncbi:general odorant-binding protein 56a-like isoform X2 [Belonocnema kinseyi]|uniref:general odorant-binding protein 56a-like isoform X2 n=1 Tax=Belonocnema kinseyi TaxID=2817044 RepID=UPI00143DBE12|nr:general odorant-binding protein 56a-like isoform X2 [Belonocnema kinseyi]